MKKLIFLSLCVFFALGVMAQGNRFYYGDKSERKVAQTIERFDKQISQYKAEIEKLDAKNDKLTSQFVRSKDGSLMTIIEGKIATNDSLIKVYRTKVDEAEFTKEEILMKLDGKEKTAFISSRGNNPQELLAASTAYSNMVYADAYAKKMTEANTVTNPVSKMTASVTNLYFRDAQVVVTGPNGFKVENHLPMKTGNFVFEIPGPGIYTATFLYHETGGGYVNAVVTKEVTLNPNQISYDPRGGKHNVCFTMLKGY